MLASGGRDSTIRIWDVESNRLITSVRLEPEVEIIDISVYQKELVLACSDGTVRVYRLDHNKM